MSGESHGAIFDPNGQGNNIDLNEMVLNGNDWIFLEAVGINNNGWIIGIATNELGYYRAVLILPCPTGDFDDDCDVDFFDFAVIGTAWASKLGDGNWNPACDISDPNDDIIDGKDLDVFFYNWLTGTGP